MDFTPEETWKRYEPVSKGLVTTASRGRACGRKATHAQLRSHRRRTSLPLRNAFGSLWNGGRLLPRWGLSGYAGGRPGVLRLASKPSPWPHRLPQKILGGALTIGSRELFSAVSHHHPRRQGQSKSIATQFAPRHRIRLRPDALARRVNFVLVFGLLEMQHPSTCRNRHEFTLQLRLWSC
jgi:hypothetical protein